ncbi:hypothetical protein [Xenorhabdus nematophila]|uniref:hypothetical protein n=1 Tax=Xenorhabdus nematophila TaxID=628 RepID=UPI0013924220|nr:hypothetical protein [Xenorhabdus nematophila]
MTEVNGKKPALCKFNKMVVMPKPIKPNGPGFANLLEFILPLENTNKTKYQKISCGNFLRQENIKKAANHNVMASTKQWSAEKKFHQISIFFQSAP